MAKSLTAKVGAYSSVVGGGVHIHEPDGRFAGQVAFLSQTDTLRDKALQMAMSEAIAKALNELFATPEALAASPEVAKLVADAEARGMERALETMKTTGDSAVTEAMGQRLCCNGQDCGCHGATVEQYLEHLIRAEAAAICREACK